MTKIHLIIGLPGSGKTHYAKTVLGHLPLVDDIKDQCELLDVEEFVITDPNFCDAYVIVMAEQNLAMRYPNLEISLVYFENDPEKAMANVKRRNDDRWVEPTIKRFSRVYHPPKDALKIYSE